MRLLIADDEEYTRKGLVKDIAWKALGITEIMQAENGKEALEIAAWFKPDIILTDVRMPKLSGIEFAQRLVHLFPNSMLLFMSGYMDIDSLKSAISLSAVEFIEKPIVHEAVEGAIRKAVAMLLERARHADNQKAQVELVRQKLANMLRYKNKDQETVQRMLVATGFPAQGSYLCSVFHDAGDDSYQDTLRLRVQSHFEEKGIAAICAACEDGLSLCILGMPASGLRQAHLLWQDLLRDIPQLIVGIGMRVDSLSALHNSYQLACLAASRYFYHADTRLFEGMGAPQAEQDLPANLFSKFMQLSQRTPETLYDWTVQLMDDVSAREVQPYQQVRLMASMMAKALCGGTQAGQDAEREMLASKTMEQLRARLLSHIRAYQSDHDEKEGLLPIVALACRAIRTRFAEPALSVADIAGEVHLSPTHLNVLFKQETGTTIKQYLVNYRLERAVQWLEDVRYSIQEVALGTGFSDASYFIRVFKAKYGITPAEHRKQRHP